MSWDQHILLFAATYRSSSLDAVLRFVTWFGSLCLLAPLAALLTGALLALHKYREALMLMVGFGGATLSVHLAKAWLNRPRPSLLEPLIALPGDSSFPSAHTAQVTAFALAVALIVRHLWPEWQVLGFVMAISLMIGVGLSRIYLQVHYPSDVLGGGLLAIVWVVLAREILL